MKIGRKNKKMAFLGRGDRLSTPTFWEDSMKFKNTITIFVFIAIFLSAVALIRFDALMPLAQEKRAVAYKQTEDDTNVYSKINSYMIGNDLIIEYSSDSKPRIEGLAADRYKIFSDKYLFDKNEHMFGDRKQRFFHIIF